MTSPYTNHGATHNIPRVQIHFRIPAPFLVEDWEKSEQLVIAKPPSAWAGSKEGHVKTAR